MQPTRDTIYGCTCVDIINLSSIKAITDSRKLRGGYEINRT